MNKYKVFSKMWFLVLLLVAFVAGCASNGAEVVSSLGPRALASISLTPPSASIPVTGTQRYTVIAIFSDGTSSDVTVDSILTPGTSGVSFGAIPGRATGVTANATPVVITATYTLAGVTKTATVSLTVNDATSTGFSVKPDGIVPLVSIPVSGTQQYAAIETFSDGTSYDRTTDSVWTASTNGVTWNSTKGFATGAIASATPVVITATYTFAGVTQIATADLTVNAASSSKFEVTPQTAEISINGGSQQYAAIETFSDGTSFDRAQDPNTTWTAVDLTGTGVATIGLHTGLATGAALGTSTITATYTVGGVIKTDSAILTVTAPNPGAAGPGVNLGTAGTYGMIASDAMTVVAVPATHIYGNIALINNDSFVGFDFTGPVDNKASIYVTGKVNSQTFGDPAATTQAQIDLNAAYNDLSTRTPTTVFPSAAATELSGKLLSPGIYEVFTPTSQTLALSADFGPLVLDAGGNPDAIFIFKAFAMTTTTGSVVLQNGANAKNIFWLVNTSATIGDGTSTFFQGTIVAGNTITVGLNSNVQGRMLAGALGAGAITNSGVITVPK